MKISEALKVKKKRLLNKSGTSACGYRLVVKPDTVESVSKGGIILPGEAKDAKQLAATTGLLVDVGPTAWLRHDGGIEWAKAGDRVAFAKYGGHEFIGTDGETYKILNDEDLQGRLVKQ